MIASPFSNYFYQDHISNRDGLVLLSFMSSGRSSLLVSYWIFFRLFCLAQQDEDCRNSGSGMENKQLFSFFSLLGFPYFFLSFFFTAMSA